MLNNPIYEVMEDLNSMDWWSPQQMIDRVLFPAIHKRAMQYLFQIEPFNEGIEKELLLHFDNKIKAHTKLIKINGTYDAHFYETMRLKYYQEISSLYEKLKTQDTLNEVYRILIGVCGIILGVLASLPLGLPWFFSPVRNYIGSFFVKSTAKSAEEFFRAANLALEQVDGIHSGRFKGYIYNQSNELNSGNYRFNLIPRTL